MHGDMKYARGCSHTDDVQQRNLNQLMATGMYQPKWVEGIEKDRFYLAQPLLSANVNIILKTLDSVSQCISTLSTDKSMEHRIQDSMQVSGTTDLVCLF